MTVNRQPVRYFGGKVGIAPWIVSYFPDHWKYVELFGGSGSILMVKPRSEVEVYNDLDDQVVELFKVLRDENLAHELERRLRLTPYSRIEFVRAFRRAKNPVERVRRMLVRAYMSVHTNGVYRYCSGDFRSHTGTNSHHVDAWLKYPDALRGFTRRLRRVIIENQDYKKVIERHDGRGVLFYADPPYVHTTRSAGHTGEYTFEFTRKNHIEMGRILSGVRGMVVVSGYASELYDRKLFVGWKRVSLRVRANSPARGVGGNHSREEVLWLSPNIKSGQPRFL